jgi:MFS family permease
MLGSLACGLTNGSFWALAPVFCVAISSDLTLTAHFMTAVVLGSAVGQWPLGWLSDRTDRRYVLTGISLTGVFIGTIVWLMSESLTYANVITLGALWGAVAFPVYSISVAHANDRAESGTFVMVSAGLLLMYGIGAIAGPLLASALMTYSSAASLFLFTAVIHLLLAAYVALRSTQREQVSELEQTSFSEALASTQTRSLIFEDELDRGENSQAKQ